jgi:hypothetical protein
MHGNGAEDCDGTHRPAVEDDPRPRIPRGTPAYHRVDVIGLVVAEAGAIAARSARAAEVDEDRSVAEIVKAPGGRQKRFLACSVAMKEDDDRIGT